MIGACNLSHFYGIFGKRRNEEVFEGKKFGLLKVAKLAYTYYTDSQISSQQFEGFSIDPVNSRWNVPPSSYSKLNVDGGFWDRQGAFGGVLRDEKGTRSGAFVVEAMLRTRCMPKLLL